MKQGAKEGDPEHCSLCKQRSVVKEVSAMVDFHERANADWSLWVKAWALQLEKARLLGNDGIVTDIGNG